MPIAMSADPELKPSMKIWVYPDGSIKLLYKLLSTIGIPLSSETKPVYAPKGDLGITYTCSINKYDMIHKFKGSGRIKSELVEGDLVNKVEVLLAVDLAGAGNSTYSEVRGDAVFGFSSYAKLSSKNISLIVKDIYIAAYKDREEIVAEFTFNISGTEIEIPLNTTKEYLNNKLRERGINYVEFEEFKIKSTDNIYTIHTIISISIIRAIEFAISQGFITEDEGKKIRECFAKSFCEFYKLDSGLLLGFHGENYEKGANIVFESEGYLAFGTNITKFMEISAECSGALSKLVQFITQQLGATPPPMPGIPAKPIKPLFQPVIPSKSIFELYVDLDVYDNTQLINVSLTLDTGRFRAINASLDIEGTKSSLKSLKEFIVSEIMPLTFFLRPYFTQIGIKGDVLPATVELVEGKVDNIIATPIDKVIELLRLDQAKIVVTTPITPLTITGTTITISMPITETTTIIKTETIATTLLKTEILTKTLPTTILIITTTTAVEREWGTTIGIGAALLVVGIAVGYILRRARSS